MRERNGVIECAPELNASSPPSKPPALPKKEKRKIIQIATATVSMGAIGIPTVFALSDDGGVFFSMQEKAGIYKDWQALPALPEEKQNG